MQQRPLTDAEKKMVEDNLHLIDPILLLPCNRSYRRTLGWDEARQVAALALMRAAQKFDPARGRPFKTYATHWVRSLLGKAVQRSSTMRDKNVRIGSRPGPRKMVAAEDDKQTDDVRDPVFSAEIRDRLAKCHHLLDARMRKVVWMYAQGYEFPQIGRRLRVSRQRALQLYQEARNIILTDEYLNQQLKKGE